jgi:hypothetical protein
LFAHRSLLFCVKEEGIHPTWRKVNRRKKARSLHAAVSAEDLRLFSVSFPSPLECQELARMRKEIDSILPYLMSVGIQARRVESALSPPDPSSLQTSTFTSDPLNRLLHGFRLSGLDLDALDRTRYRLPSLSDVQLRPNPNFILPSASADVPARIASHLRNEPKGR